MDQEKEINFVKYFIHWFVISIFMIFILQETTEWDNKGLIAVVLSAFISVPLTFYINKKSS